MDPIATCKGKLPGLIFDQKPPMTIPRLLEIVAFVLTQSGREGTFSNNYGQLIIFNHDLQFDQKTSFSLGETALIQVLVNNRDVYKAGDYSSDNKAAYDKVLAMLNQKYGSTPALKINFLFKVPEGDFDKGGYEIRTNLAKFQDMDLGTENLANRFLRRIIVVARDKTKKQGRDFIGRIKQSSMQTKGYEGYYINLGKNHHELNILLEHPLSQDELQKDCQSIQRLLNDPTNVRENRNQLNFQKMQWLFT